MMFEDITREYGSDVGPLRRHSAEKQNDSKRNSLRKRSMPIVTHNNEQDLEAVEVEKTNFSVVIAPKVKTIKIKVIPDDILLWLTIPLNCSASISEIEQKIRQELSNSDPCIFNDYKMYSLHLDGSPISCCEIFSEHWKNIKDYSFKMPGVSFGKKKSRIVRRTMSMASETIPASPKATRQSSVKKQELLRSELAEVNTKYRKLKKKYLNVKEKSPLFPKTIEIMSTIGRGSAGVVYSCNVNGWICAMKELDNDSEAASYELKALTKIPTHKNIVKYFMHREVNDKLQIFLRLYSRSLADDIKIRADNCNPYTPKELISILCDIANGLQLLHQNSIIHRDLKSDNIFITHDGASEVYAIGDLDTSKVTSYSTRAKTVIGTTAFMAPEVFTAENENAYTKKVDVFSFGMIIFELLFLKLPYTEVQKSYLISKYIIDGTPPKMEELGTEYAVFVDLFNRCISKNPEDRPSSKSLFQIFENLRKSESNSSDEGH